MLIAGFVPILSLIVLFVFYLSLTIAGQTFLSFQWDILLLEAGFLAIFFAPATWRMTAKPKRHFRASVFFCCKLLLFKLMFMSGVVKLTSGDDSWWNLTALDYHYWSQPLPTVLGMVGRAEFRMVEEILYVRGPLRRNRGAVFNLGAAAIALSRAFVLFVSLQIMIALTGNYCFFNLLTIALCFLLLDDAQIARRTVAALYECR